MKVTGFVPSHIGNVCVCLWVCASVCVCDVYGGQSEETGGGYENIFEHISLLKYSYI